MESAAKRRLGDIIVERGLVSPHQLEEALQVQRQSGGKLGEVLVELGFITRVALAGVINEQWDSLRSTVRSRQPAEKGTPTEPQAQPSVVETSLRERLEALTFELAGRDQRIAQQDATIAALLALLQPAAPAEANPVRDTAPRVEAPEPAAPAEPQVEALEVASEPEPQSEAQELAAEPEPQFDA